MSAKTGASMCGAIERAPSYDPKSKLYPQISLIRSALRTDKSVAAIAREFGVHATTLVNFIKKYRIVDLSARKMCMRSGA